MTKVSFHINSLLAGGIEKVLIDLLRALPRDKYDISLLITYEFGAAEVLRPTIPDDIPVTYLLPISPLTRTHVKKKTGKVTGIEKLLSEIFITPFKKSVLRRRLREAVQDADVVVDFDMTLAPLHEELEGKRKVAYCHFSLANYWDGNTRKLARLARRLAHYDKVVMLCDEMKDEAGKMFPYLAPKLLRIYNAVDIGRIRAMGAEAIDSSKLPEAAQAVGYIVSVGRLQEGQKDFGTLLRAYAICVKQYGVAEGLVIVGHGGSREALETLAKELGVMDRVYFTGYQDNPHKWVARSKLFVFSSKYEGLPTVIIEALALGKPVVATACPTGVRELLMNGEAGVLTPVGDAEAMAAAMSQLLNDEAAQQRFYEAAAGYLHNFSMEHKVEEIEGVFAK